MHPPCLSVVMAISGAKIASYWPSSGASYSLTSCGMIGEVSRIEIGISKMIKKSVLAGAFLLAACEVTQPVAVIGDKGEIFKGTATASMAEGGRFSASNGSITCGGSYNLNPGSQTTSFPVICSDGRKGIGTATRDASGVTGSGTIRMNDGSAWTFVFGPSANAF